MKFVKKWWLLFLIAGVAVYLAVGAAAPFIHYKVISDTQSIDISMNDFSHEESCDRAMLLETNKHAWEERIRLINLAEERIILSTFDMREGESTKDLLSILLQKAEEGVDIRILVDGISGQLRMDGKELFYALSAHSNVQVRLYNKLNFLLPWRTQGRMHDKYVIVDDKAYILGGRNTFDYFIGDYPAGGKSYDREVLIYNTNQGTKETKESSLSEIEDYFNRMWNMEVCTDFHNDECLLDERKVREETEMLKKRYSRIKADYPELFEPYSYEENTYQTKGIRLLSNPTGIYGKEPVLFYQLTELMKQAKESVTIHTPYAVCNSYMCETIEEVVDKVPKVTMMLNSVENGDNFVASSDYTWNKKKLIDTGVTIYEYDGGMSYHGKTVVIDGTLSLIGSYNFDLRSTYVDTELMLAVQSEGLAGELLQHMEDFQKDCRKVVDKDSYEVPAHLVIQKVPLWKRTAWRIAGVILQPFRCLV